MKLKENAFVRNTGPFHKEFYRFRSEGLEGMKVVHIEAQHFFSSSRWSDSTVCWLVLSFTVGIKCSGRPLRGDTGSFMGILLISNVRKEHVRLVGYTGLEPTSTLSTYCRKSSIRKCSNCHS